MLTMEKLAVRFGIGSPRGGPLRMRTTSMRCLLVVAALTSQGCGDAPPATFSGAILIGGRPMPSDTNIIGTVMLCPVARAAASYGAVREGRYEVNTGSSEGLKPGTYDVTVRIVKIGPPAAGGGPPGQKLLHPGH